MSDLTAQEVANTVVNDLNIASVQALITPAQLKKICRCLIKPAIAWSMVVKLCVIF